MNSCEKPKINLGNLLGAIDTDFGGAQVNRFAVRVRKRDRFSVVVVRIVRMRVLPVMMGVAVICGNLVPVMVVVVIQIQQGKARIVMKRSQPRSESESREGSHQETVLTQKH